MWRFFAYLLVALVLASGTHAQTMPDQRPHKQITNTPQSITKGWAVTPVNYGIQAAAGTLLMDWSQSNSALFTFGAGNLTVANPVGIRPGQNYQIAVKQDAVGGRTITWGSMFKWGGATAPTLSTGAGNKDVLSCWADTATTLECTLAIVNAS